MPVHPSGNYLADIQEFVEDCLGVWRAVHAALVAGPEDKLFDRYKKMVFPAIKKIEPWAKGERKAVAPPSIERICRAEMTPVNSFWATLWTSGDIAQAQAQAIVNLKSDPPLNDSRLREVLGKYFESGINDATGLRDRVEVEVAKVGSVAPVDLLTPTEAAVRAQCDKSLISKKIQDGTLETVKDGKKKKVVQHALSQPS